VVKRKIN